jgi:serine protease Do
MTNDESPSVFTDVLAPRSGAARFRRQRIGAIVALESQWLRAAAAAAEREGCGCAKPQQPAGFADLSPASPRSSPVVQMDETQRKGLGLNEEDDPPPTQDSPLEKFFQQYGFGEAPGETPQQRQIVIGAGSGFFISPDGYAVTNNHVVDHAQSVQVTTDDGTTYKAKVIGTDPKTDLALIKVDGKSSFAYANFADRAPRVGDWVVAVGNPFGLGGTVTAGIVSAQGRDIGSGPYDNYIQIDAPINKGNSGGPAFDMKGKVIGVNTAIYSPSGY